MLLNVKYVVCNNTLSQLFLAASNKLIYMLFSRLC